MNNEIVIEHHIVPEGTSKQRLSDYLIGVFKTIPTRKGIKKAIKKGSVRVNGEIQNTAHWIESGQIIELLDIEKTPQKIFPLEFPVLFEDNYLAIINKPAGYVVSGNLYQTIENALPHHLTPSNQLDALKNYRAVHRLDALTSGLLLIAKTRIARVKLGKLFEERNIQKTYQALVIGKTPTDGTIQIPVDDKPSLSEFKTLKQVRSLRNDWLSLLELYPKTGRTHQLRIHLSNIGFPILGDKIYGKEGEILKHKGLFLCATRLEFEHPFTKEKIDLRIESPNKFRLMLEREQRRWEKYN
jgi:RluA family pseudouridine synthase